MPLTQEGEDYAPKAPLPSGTLQLGPSDLVLAIRCTGELFSDYEDYIKQLNIYRQRIWKCKYTGAGELTYEEALTSEYSVSQLVDKMPKLYEQDTMRLVHHSLESANTLPASILRHWAARFAVGEIVTGTLPNGTTASCAILRATAPQQQPTGGDNSTEQQQDITEESDKLLQADPSDIVYEVSWLDADTKLPTGKTSTSMKLKDLARDQEGPPKELAVLGEDFLKQWIDAVAYAEPVQGVFGVECIWRVLDYFRHIHNLPEALPQELAERLRPTRQAAANIKNVTHRAAIAGGSVDEVLKQAGVLEDGDIVMQDAGALIGEEAAAWGADGGVEGYGGDGEEGDYYSDDDEYQPNRFNAADLPYKARGRGRGGRGRGRGRPPLPTSGLPPSSGGGSGSRGRGRGRGRWAAKYAAEEAAALAAANLAAGATAAGISGAPGGIDSDLLLAGHGDSIMDDVEVELETMEQVEARLTNGSIKHSVFNLLKEAGERGMTLAEMAQAIIDRGLKQWDDFKTARNSVASTIGHDPAFVRIGPGTFALSVLMDPEKLKLFYRGGRRSGAGGQHIDRAEPAKALAAVEAAYNEALKKLHEEQNKPKTDHNQFKCTKCHRMTHVELSPLLLCDTCPRAYHVACLEEPYTESPHEVWSCPKCHESTQLAMKRVSDLEIKKKEAMERAASREKMAEDMMVRRLLSSKDQRDVFGLALPVARRDDWEVLEEEKGNLVRLQARVKELQGLAARQQQNGGGASGSKPAATSSRRGAGNNATTTTANAEAMAIDSSGNKLAGASSLSRQTSVGSLFGASDEIDYQERANAAAQAVERLKTIISGPPAVYPPVVEGSVAHALLGEAFTVAEFLSLYGGACEVRRELSAQELLEAAAWPLDWQDELAPLYQQLLLCCLLEQLNRDPPMKGKSRRWTRVLLDSTWPEVLRRYILNTRCCTQALPADGSAPQPTTNTGNSDKNALIPFVLLRDEKQVRHLAEDELLSAPEEDFARFACFELSQKHWWDIPSSMHIRLLSMLCYDIAQGTTLREDINARVQDCLKLQSERTGGSGRGRKRNSAAANTTTTPAGTEGKGKKKAVTSAGGASNKKATKQQSDANGDNNEQQQTQGDDDVDGNNTNNDQDDQGGGNNTDTARGGGGTGDIEEQLSERAFRTEPLGFDRHHNRYWWLRGCHGFVFVESMVGSSLGAIATEQDLEKLVVALNRRAPREANLAANIDRHRSDIIESFSQGSDPARLTLKGQPRPPIPEGQTTAKTLTQLKTEALTANFDDVKEKLESFLTECQDIGVPFSMSLKDLRTKMRAVKNATQLCDYLLLLETALVHAGEGLPLNGDNKGIAKWLTPEEVAVLLALPPVPDDQLPMQRQERQASMRALKEQQESQEQAEAMDIDGTVKTEDGQDDAMKQVVIKPEDQPVVRDDDLDDSDAEHAYLREKRMRRPARLWRSGRERANWLKTVLAAKDSAGTSDAAATQAAYCTFLFCDRAGPMMQRFVTLAEENAKWEAQEREWAKKEAEAKAKQEAIENHDTRPMMIRTGKAKTDEGIRVMLKAMGKEPLPSGRNALTLDTVATPEQVKGCKWSYTCSVCQLAGDLLCCEHADGCNVSAHTACTGQPFPTGAWICPNHDDPLLKSRISRRNRGARRNALLADYNNGENDEDSDESAEIEAELEAEREKKRARRRRGKKAAAGKGGDSDGGGESDGSLSADSDETISIDEDASQVTGLESGDD